MKPLAKAWAIFPPPINPIFNIFVSMFNVTLFFFSSPSPRSWSLTVQRKTKFRKYELSYLLKMQHMQLSLSIIYRSLYTLIFIHLHYLHYQSFLYIFQIYSRLKLEKNFLEKSLISSIVNNNIGGKVLKEKKKIPSLSTPKAHNNRENIERKIKNHKFEQF